MSTSDSLECFKAYDIRGRLGDQLNPDVAYRIARAYAEYLKPENVVLGGDVRESSEELKAALARGLLDAGVDVFDIGLAGTEEVYFATFHLRLSGGIEVTASHNPLDYNGMKLVREGARPVSGDTGLKEIRRLAERNDFSPPASENHRGTCRQISVLDDYVEHLTSYIDIDKLRPLKILLNSGNGAAGHVVDALERALRKTGAPVSIIKFHHDPDATFPNGIPNPLLPENRQDTSDAVIEHGADIGVAFDGDFDRCFFFDEKGSFIEGYYLVGLLAEACLKHDPGGKIIHDPRLTWNTIELVRAAHGVPVESKTGHAFIKERMRKEGAIYGGEMSAHHYFKRFAYCDSGMIPWLLVAELVSTSGKKLSELVEERQAEFPCSGEINFKIENPEAAIKNIEEHYGKSALSASTIDGLSLEFSDWRFNLRSSNTEPLVRLNIESRGSSALVQEKVDELSRALIQASSREFAQS